MKGSGCYKRNQPLDISEVVAMLNFDLMDTVAGRQVYEEGLVRGVSNSWGRQQLFPILLKSGRQWVTEYWSGGVLEY